MYTIQRNEGGMPVSLVGESRTERRVITRINAAVALAKARGRVITPDAARLIAAVINDGPRSALARFAATGELHRSEAHLELFDIPTDTTPIPWWDAMDDWLTAQTPRREAA